MRRKRKLKKHEPVGLSKKIHFITYGNNKYYNSKKRLIKEAKNFYNFESLTDYGPENLDNDFVKKFNHVLSQPRGGGYWIWKPHIIYKKMKEIKEGEYLLYLDAGFIINNEGFERFVEYINMLENSDKPLLGFKMSHQIEKWWTTDKIFEYFDVMKNSNIINDGQLIGGFQLMKKCDFVLKVLEKWNKVIRDDVYLFTDHYDCKRPDFKENRHDQSIISVIRKLEGGIFLEDETWFLDGGFGSEKSLKYPFWAARKS